MAVLPNHRLVFLAELAASRSQKRHPRSLHPPDLVHRAWPSSLDRPMLVNREFCEKGSGQLHATEHGSSAFRGQGRLRSYEFCTTCRVATAPRQSKVKIPPEGNLQKGCLTCMCLQFIEKAHSDRVCTWRGARDDPAGHLE
ncbi:uncharacterized protein LOC118547164 isoform X2 [Halichoerus grypus]